MGMDVISKKKLGIQVISKTITGMNVIFPSMNSVPPTFTAIFSSYEWVFTKLRQHYLASDVLVGLLTGKPIHEIHTVQEAVEYSI
jgi:hypothetical protein